MPPGLRRGDRDGFMASRGEHHDSVERFFEQVLPIGEAAVDAVVVTNPLDDGSREITNGGNLEPIVELAQVVEVHHLGDEAATDDTNAQSRFSQTARDYTPPAMIVAISRSA